MAMTGICYAVLISLTVFAMAGAPANGDLDKSQIMKFILEQLKLKVLTQQMKQSVRVMKGVLQYTSELDMQHQRSLKRLVCMVDDLNGQMIYITKSYYNNKSKVKDLNSRLNDSQRRVQYLEQENNELSYKVESLQRYVNITRDCEKRQHLQQIKEVVQRYINNSDWTTMKRDLSTLLNHSSEEYSQLQYVGTMTHVGHKGYTQLASLLLCAGLPVDKTYSGYTIMHWAAYWGRLQLVKLLLDHGSNVNVRNYNDGTPLMSAAWGGDLEVVKWLVHSGADANARDKDNNTALDVANKYSHKAVAQYLEPLTH